MNQLIIILIVTIIFISICLYHDHTIEHFKHRSSRHHGGGHSRRHYYPRSYNRTNYVYVDSYPLGWGWNWLNPYYWFDYYPYTYY